MVKEPCGHSTKLIRKCSYEKDLTVLNARWMAMNGEKERGFLSSIFSDGQLGDHSLWTMPPTQILRCIAKCCDFLAAVAVAP